MDIGCSGLADSAEANLVSDTCNVIVESVADSAESSPGKLMSACAIDLDNLFAGRVACLVTGGAVAGMLAVYWLLKGWPFVDSLSYLWDFTGAIFEVGCCVVGQCCCTI